ncbi:hypothetical protein [Streptomyces sp. BH105]|uniref:hypothetical protein n=1 Tax=Streptomyces sp. BH105 TaxID=3410408 RepID=UPI003CEDD418
MDEIGVRDLRRDLAECLNDTQWNGRFIRITRSGRTAGFLVPPEFEDQVAALEDQAADKS